MIFPFGCFGGCQVRLTDEVSSSEGIRVRSRGGDEGAASWVVLLTLILHVLSREPFTTLTLNSYSVFGLEKIFHTN